MLARLLLLLILMPTVLSAQPSAHSYWVGMARESMAVVSAVVEDKLWVKLPHMYSESWTRIGPNTVRGSASPISDYVIGRVFRLRVQEVAKADWRIQEGETIDVFVPEWTTALDSLDPDFERGEKYLLFLVAPIGLQGEHGLFAPEDFVGYTIGRPGPPSADDIEFHALQCYRVLLRQDACRKFTPEALDKLSAIMSEVAATVAPTVAITQPKDGTCMRTTIELSANADDDVMVAGVRFLVDGANLGDELGSESFGVYRTEWDTKQVADGNHVLTAVARDVAGYTATSTSIGVLVDNTAPSLEISANVASPGPPEGLVPLVIEVTAKDNLDKNPVVRLVSVESMEERDRSGTPSRRRKTDISDVEGAVYGTDDREFLLRAGHAYTITYSATDAAGNTATASTTVRVEPTIGRRRHPEAYRGGRRRVIGSASLQALKKSFRPPTA